MYNRWSEFQETAGYFGPKLRDWQVNALMAWERNSHRGVVEAVTGTGKSLVGVAAIREATAQGGSALVVVPTKALADQWADVIRNNLPSLLIGRLGNGNRDTFDTAQVVVGTVQSLYRKPLKAKSLTLVVADEVHRYGAEKWSEAFVESYSWRLGLTATYERLGDDGVEETLAPYFSSKVYSYNYGAALTDGVVAPFNLALVGLDFSPSERAAYEEAVEKADDARQKLIFNYGYETDWANFFSRVTRALKQRDYEDDLEGRLCGKYVKGWSDRRKITADSASKLGIIENLAASFACRSGTLVFGSTVDSVVKLAYVIGKSTSSLALHGKSTNEERQEGLRSFQNGDLKVVCAPQILNEGIDVPDAEVAVIVGASQNRREMIQRMGRVIRLKSDNRFARILITFMKGTPEDPASGGHEAFLSEVLPHAASIEHFEAENLSEIRRWLEEEMANG